MQYLAEVQKKSGVFGGGKAELKLLACLRGESWTAVPGEETIPADEAGNFNAGALVLAEINANKQLQGTPKEAGRQIVSILQNYSRLQEKTKTQEEEIEQWKQSLTYQSQELNRREMEMQAQLEQFEQIQQEIDQLETKRNEIAAMEEEAQKLREEMERRQQELEAAWEQLNAQQSQQDATEPSGFLDAEQVNGLQEWLNYLAQVVISPEAAIEPLNSSLSSLSAQQAAIEERQQQLEQQRQEAQQQQDEVDATAGELDGQWQQWHAGRADLERVRSELAVRQSTLDLERRLAEALRSQLQSQESLMQQLSQLSTGGGGSVSTGDGDLEGMPLHELQRRVRKAREELASNFPFVSDQEEELTLQRQEIDELMAKMKNTFGAEREGFEKDIADQEEGYKFLNETLVGQWRNLQDRQRVLEQHQLTLWRRLGNPEFQGSGGAGASANVEPLLKQIEELRQQQQAELQAVEERLAEMQQGFEEWQAAANDRAAAQDNQLNELKEKERQLQERRSSVAQLWGRVTVSEEILQSLQESLNELQQNLEALSESTAHLGEMSEAQNNAIAQLQASLSALTGESA
ncbi:MAG TPA: hypothetical protein IGS17_14790 [Oscillatoriales cyanobacterium M59_W2019_021]|nr:MAG: hypothetical protein D6728_06770 [Cyanobacteria bacterium J055]HIK30168.1 hypothetical protein [Oscillatoriales cyanobacterium M4454_W2019_049]HIK52172.1 hypothetical protein [Oscillatoriales cyanobacterium M59_W2019_021]